MYLTYEGKTDTNRHEGEEFISTYPVDNIFFCIIKLGFVFSYLLYLTSNPK
jgi:hypothetical protein